MIDDHHELSVRWQAKATRDQPGQLSELLGRLEPEDVLLVTRLDRLARSTRDLLKILAAVDDKGAAFRSLADN